MDSWILSAICFLIMGCPGLSVWDVDHLWQLPAYGTGELTARRLTAARHNVIVRHLEKYTG